MVMFIILLFNQNLPLLLKFNKLYLPPRLIIINLLLIIINIYILYYKIQRYFNIYQLFLSKLYNFLFLKICNYLYIFNTFLFVHLFLYYKTSIRIKFYNRYLFHKFIKVLLWNHIYLICYQFLIYYTFNFQL